MLGGSRLSTCRNGALTKEAFWLADASGLPQGPPGGGAALAGLAVPTHCADRGCLRELVRGQEVPADRHGVVSSPACSPCPACPHCPLRPLALWGLPRSALQNLKCDVPFF